MTLDVVSATYAMIDNMRSNEYFETFCQCRHCFKTSIFLLYDRTGHDIPTFLDGSITDRYELREIIRPDAATIDCPEFVPDDLKAIFDEGAECLAINCWNAAGAMFRKVVDVVSKAKLPADDGANGPSKQARRVLKARLDWLLANGLLPAGIAELADCIREDGNDAVHEHPIGKDEAGDLADFTVQLLEGVYTQPGRLKAASERRAQRRKEKPTP